MRRSLLIALKISLLVALAVWIVERPGTVTVEWLGWRLEEASVGLLILAAAVLVVIASLIYHGWRVLRGTPGGISRKLAGNKRQRGYKALSQGMAAVAAGDAAEAARCARRAETLLAEPPLTRLLQAQAAQLNGDEDAARRYFQEMLEVPDTRFLGLRGLINQALKGGDDALALDYLRKARDLRPKAPWVLTTLFELAERQGELALADQALEAAGRIKALPAPESAHKRAVLALLKAQEREAAGDSDGARKEARRARKLAPDLLPAYLTLARLALAAGRAREAQKILEDAWSRSPHPELATLYRLSLADIEPIEALRRLERLAARNASHPESHIALAEAALAAKLWGQGRRHLGAIADDLATARVCRLWAALEESENGPGEAVRHWLERSLAAPPDALWLCDTCGTQAYAWRAHCGHCGTFDSLTWRPPRTLQETPDDEPAGLIEQRRESNLPALTEA